jgi:hypothetical protein
VALGLFGCAPVSPSLAVDFRVLELVKALFVRMTPNMSGWTEALEDFLNDRGYKLATKVSYVFACCINRTEFCPG